MLNWTRATDYSGVSTFESHFSGLVKWQFPSDWHSSSLFETEVFPITNTQGVLHLPASDESPTQKQNAQQVAWPNKSLSLPQAPGPPDSTLRTTLSTGRKRFSASPATPSLTHRAGCQAVPTCLTCSVSSKPPHSSVLVPPTGVRLLLRLSRMEELPDWQVPQTQVKGDPSAHVLKGQFPLYILSLTSLLKEKKKKGNDIPWRHCTHCLYAT